MGTFNPYTAVVKNTKFYSEEDFEYETNLLIEYLEEDLNQTVVIYEVDRERTNINDIYKDARENQIRFKTPREIPCMYEIKEADLKSLDNKTNTGLFAVGGTLTLHVMTKILEKYHCDIKRGDYVGVKVDVNRMVYYTVVNDGKVNTANTNIVGAYKPVWRVVTCAPVDIKEFNG